VFHKFAMVSSRQYALTKLLMRIDEQIFETELMILELLSDEELHRTIDHLAELQRAKLEVEGMLKAGNG
jgi:hypothetical protein